VQQQRKLAGTMIMQFVMERRCGLCRGANINNLALAVVGAGQKLIPVQTAEYKNDTVAVMGAGTQVGSESRYKL